MRSVRLIWWSSFFSILPLILYGGWEPEVRLTNYPEYFDYGSTCNNSWSIAIWDTIIHIPWEHRDTSSGEPGELYYIQSTTSGETWGSDTQLYITDIPLIMV